MTIIGLDLSLTGTGVVVLKDSKMLHSELITTKPPTEKTALTELKRLLGIVDKIKKNITKYTADIVVIEGLSMGMSFKTVSILQLAGLNYMVREMLFENNNKFEIIPPTVLKKFISNKGNSPKELVMLETYKRYGVSFEDNNLCDAYVLSRIGEALVDDSAKLTKFQQEIINSIKKI